MTHKDQQQFISLINQLAASYQEKLSKEHVAGYWMVLHQYTLPQLEEAVRSYRLSVDAGRFMPTPAELVQVLQINGRSPEAEAWYKVMCAMKKIGGGSSVIFDDPIIHAVIDEMSNWIQLNQLTTHQLIAYAKAFKHRYKDYVHRPPVHFPNVLWGEFSTKHLGSNFTPPIVFGDMASAALVYLRGNNKAHSLSQAPLLSQQHKQDAHTHKHINK